ncbi:MAG: hypothetical protein U0Q16_06810 [Bryobacteraceae bacterium]
MRSLAVLCPLLLLPVVSFAQGKGFGEIFEAAPPHIEAALREKVSFFYQAHKESKFRVADTVVHEDSKDIFFAAEKMTFRGFKIVKAAYEENFTRARVVTDIDADFFFPGFGKLAVHRPVTSFWKLDQGQWWWYVPPMKGRDSPFGTMNPGTNEGATDANPDWGAMWDKAPKVSDLQNMVKADKESVELASHQPSHAEVQFKSAFPGPLKVQLYVPDMQGLTAKLDKTELKEGETLKLIVDCKPLYPKAKKPDLTAQVIFEPLNRTIPVTIKFAHPPNQ